MSALLARLARQRCLASPLDAGRRIYRLEGEWEPMLLQEDPATARADSLEGLRRALADTSVATVLIPAESGVTLEGAARAVDQSGQQKTLFLEQKV